MRRGHLEVVFALVALGVVGCHGAQEGGDGSGTGVLLLDRDARSAGFAVETAGHRASPVLPVELGDDEDVAVVGPTGRMAVSGAAGELLHVHGVQGKIDSRQIGEEVEADRVLVQGTEDAAKALAAILSGEVAPTDDGAWEIKAANALQAAAGIPAPDGLLALLPAEKAATLDQKLEGAAIAGLAAQNARRPVRVENTSSFDQVLAKMKDYGLPPAVECRDAIAGTWMSQDYDERYGDWYVFTVQIKHVAGSPNQITGEIEAHAWDGGPLDTKPTACENGGAHWTVKMTAEGTVDSGEVHFGGTSWHVAQVFCGRSPGPNEYNLDKFSGYLDASGFRAVNNDGGRMLDRPTPFRHVKCQ